MLKQTDHSCTPGLEAHIEQSALSCKREELLEHGPNRQFVCCHRHEIGNGAHNVLWTRQLSRLVYLLDMDKPRKIWMLFSILNEVRNLLIVASQNLDRVTVEVLIESVDGCTTSQLISPIETYMFKTPEQV